MAYRTTHTDLGKIYSTLLSWLRSKSVALTGRIFGNVDASARHHGWQVTAAHGGFGRGYRDPRFDSLAACADCIGHGTDARGRSCHICTGTGRIILKPTIEPPSSCPSRGQA